MGTPRRAQKAWGSTEKATCSSPWTVASRGFLPLYFFIAVSWLVFLWHAFPLHVSGLEEVYYFV